MLAKFKPILNSLRDTLLFAQPFRIVADLPLQDSVDRLMNLSQPIEGFVLASGQEVWCQKISDNAYEFKLHLRRQERMMRYTSAICVGQLIIGNTSDKTVVNGRIMAGDALLYIDLLFAIAMLFIVYLSLATVFCFFVLLLLCTLLARRDQRYLQQLIAEVLR